MKFFNECKTIDEVKATFKKLAFANHPDCGGDTATMQAINAEYAYAIAAIARGENFTDQQISDLLTENELYRVALEAIICLAGIEIELVGSWIWVTGNTYAVRADLKAAGYYFASKKCAWYFRSAEYRCKSSRGKSLDEIKNKYGSEKIATKGSRVFALA